MSSIDSYHEYFGAAVRCQEHLSKLAVKGSIIARYYVVLEELRNEALGYTQRIQNWPLITAEESLSGPNPSRGIGDIPCDDIDTSHRYEDSLIDLSNWAQFESLVSFSLSRLCHWKIF